MNIITIFQEIISRTLQKDFNIYLYNTLEQFNNCNGIDNYKDFIEAFDQFTADFTKESYEAFILKLDEEFMQSKTRKIAYDSKGFVTKAILTKYGWITFKRRKYQNKENGTTFKFVDELLGLKKYIRIDPYVIADLCEESASNSYAKAGRNVSKTIGNKIKYNDDINKIILSRATTRNNVIKASKIIKEPDLKQEAKIISELNILLDEKMVPSQFNEGKDHMIKSAVIFEGYRTEYGKRIRLTGKTILGSIEEGHESLLKEVADYIYYHYDTDKLIKINIMGDGANWIKALAFDNTLKFHQDINIIYGLDLFHAMQAVMRITTSKNKNYNELLTNYMMSNKKEEFEILSKSFLELNKHRTDQITKNIDYIINNWSYIQNTIRHIKYKCSMESNISHIFADIFTSRPKSYSVKGIKALLKIRLLTVNGYDIKRLYLDALKEKIKEEQQIKLNDKIIRHSKINDKYAKSIASSLIASNLSVKINRTDNRISV